MAYDEDLAGRVRELLASEPGVTEKRMFGGLAFLINGNMSVTVSRQGGLLVRLDPEKANALVDDKLVTPMVMRGRELDGWLRVDAAKVRTAKQLEQWVDRSVDFARWLPAKEIRRRAGR
jgi:TfoX/Sxy family transcriptional regulator of competence genes